MNEERFPDSHETRSRLHRGAAVLMLLVLFIFAGTASATNFNLGAFWKKRLGSVLVPNTWTTIDGTDETVGSSFNFYFPYTIDVTLDWTGTDFVIGGTSIDAGGTMVAGFRGLSTRDWTLSKSVTYPVLYSNSVWANGKIVTWGLNSSFAATTTIYNSSTNTWSQGATSSVATNKGVWTGTQVVVWGGGVLGGSATGSRYNPSTNTWNAITATGAPASRSYNSIVWTGTEAIVWGGSTSSGTVFLNTGGRYNPSTNTWGTATSVSGAVPAGRESHGALMAGTKMYIWGGVTSATPTCTNTGGIYDTASNSWTAMSTTGAPSARYFPAVGWTGTQFLVFGGFSCNDNTPINDGFIYTPGTDTWSPMATAPFLVPKQAASSIFSICKMAWSGSRMMVSCGRSDVSALYDPATNTWETYSGVITPRYGPTMVSLGSKLFVWSGLSISALFTSTEETSGGLYNLATKTWSTIKDSSGVLSGRIGSSALWTGTTVLLWGGFSNYASAYMTDGALYDPTTDTWTSMSITNMPAGRTDHSTIWTGSKMVVWGGTTSSSSGAADGGRYDPLTNTWQTITATGAPTGRSFHTAAWVNSKMIVWGGVDNSGTPVADGKIYDTSANVWSSMSSSGAPSARSEHVAVSTGTKMIIWGGKDGDGLPLGDGKVYDAVTNTWSSMSATNAPSARSQTAAFWTGSKMIVWGGTTDGGSTYVNTGAVYDPVANTWTTMSTVNVPGERGFSGAVWTGTQMAIWGGAKPDMSIFYGSGGLYVP